MTSSRKSIDGIIAFLLRFSSILKMSSKNFFVRRDNYASGNWSFRTRPLNNDDDAARGGAGRFRRAAVFRSGSKPPFASQSTDERRKLWRSSRRELSGRAGQSFPLQFRTDSRSIKFNYLLTATTMTLEHDVSLNFFLSVSNN